MEHATWLTQAMASAASPESVPIPDDADLVRAARGGSQVAFSELYTRYARVVHGILLARGPYGEAEDLVQDVFVIAFQKIASLREPKALGGWLAAIARRSATDYHRAAFRENAAKREAAHEHSTEPDANAFHVLQAIQTLPEAYREALILRLVAGLTGPEIAGRIGLTPDSVRVNLFRGMKMLRERLKGSDEV
jgi:RNA polymerase sigma-70 factor (ECF subfamily)